MPSKALLFAADVLHLARQAKVWGLQVPRTGFDFSKVMARKDQLIEDFARFRRTQLSAARFKFVRAGARFTDPHTLKLSNGRSLTARYFVVATGSVVSPPPLATVAEAGYISSDDALTLKRLPKSLIVLGGGLIACELAQFFARFDVQVTMVQRSPHVLHEHDADTAAVVESALRRDGVRLFTGTKLLDAARVNGGKSVTFEQAGRKIRVKAEEILYTLGRSPNTAGLGLDKAGVELDGARIITDARMRTSAPHIFAAGDCTGPHEIVHIAIQQGEVAGRNIARSFLGRRKGADESIDYRLLTSVVFTEPQVATVGLTEKAAQADGIPYVAASYPFNDHGKSLIMEALHGHVKLLADPRSGEILGGACVGPVGGELIHEITAAMAKRMTVRELAALPHYHPTLAEIWTYPAEALAETIPDKSRRG
jgi:pyruvate/2-oxoglutarate dehydrogenase complex dihydrolipoamide dehydrogenase (E3) component